MVLIRKHDPVVVADHVTLAHGLQVAVADASFMVPGGATTALIGPNGSGKTTVLDALVGLVRPSTGTLRVFGQAPDRVRRRVAYVLQATEVNPALPVTVAEVVRMGRYPNAGLVGRLGGDDRTAVREAMARLAVTHLASRHVRDLSGGERQRVFVAQALAQRADLLVLDEPLTGLDLPSQERITEAIERESAAGRTVVLTTHDLSDASGADHVLLLAKRVVAQGSPDEALTRESLAAAYGGQVVELRGVSMLDDASHHRAGGDHSH